jgi:hypothetical protein
MIKQYIHQLDHPPAPHKWTRSDNRPRAPRVPPVTNAQASACPACRTRMSPTCPTRNGACVAVQWIEFSLAMKNHCTKAPPLCARIESSLLSVPRSTNPRWKVMPGSCARMESSSNEKKSLYQEALCTRIELWCNWLFANSTCSIQH